MLPRSQREPPRRPSAVVPLLNSCQRPISTRPSTVFLLRANVLVLPFRTMWSRDPTKSVKTASTWSRPARTVMMSELGLVYFLDRTADRKMLNVCSSRGQQFEVTVQCPCQVGLGSHTSSACRSAVPWASAPLSALTDLEKSSLVCSSKCSRWAGESWSKMRLRDGRSGLRRKNSRQKPSECCPLLSAASWSSFRESAGWKVDVWAGVSCLQTFDHMQETSVGFVNRWDQRGRPGETAQTLNSSSYSWTIFCWKASGRGCWVRGDLSMYGRAPEGRGQVCFVWTRSSGLDWTGLDSSAQPVLESPGRTRVLGHTRDRLLLQISAIGHGAGRVGSC